MFILPSVHCEGALRPRLFSIDPPTLYGGERLIEAISQVPLLNKTNTNDSASSGSTLQRNGSIAYDLL